VLIPPGVPLYRTRAERFDDLVLQAVARLEPQWEAHLSTVEFAVEEIPPPDGPAGSARGPVPLSRLDLGSPPAPDAGPASGPRRDVLVRPNQPGDPDEAAPALATATAPGATTPEADTPNTDTPDAPDTDALDASDPDASDLDASAPPREAAQTPPPAKLPPAEQPPASDLLTRNPGAEEPTAEEPGGLIPPRIVVYRRPLLARADNEEELGELVFAVVVEEFGRLLGIDPKDVDSGYSDDD
jgi:predicted Zn-dependent protease with MMP-like domain